MGGRKTQTKMENYFAKCKENSVSKKAEVIDLTELPDPMGDL